MAGIRTGRGDVRHTGKDKKGGETTVSHVSPSYFSGQLIKIREYG